ncbi:MAG: hypothetical protein IJB10_03585 [Clostridia bacterium]|nr:hypothetical protein [Clostridia bacterium]
MDNFITKNTNVFEITEDNLQNLNNKQSFDFSNNFNNEQNLSSTEILKTSLIKKAKGFVVEEVTKEFVKEEDKMVLHKKKVTTKEFPPDAGAIKFLLELEKFNTNEFALLTDEQLKEEKIKLLNLLKGEEDEN